MRLLVSVACNARCWGLVSASGRTSGSGGFESCPVRPILRCRYDNLFQNRACCSAKERAGRQRPAL